jgi:hypothetical protein
MNKYSLLLHDLLVEHNLPLYLLSDDGNHLMIKDAKVNDNGELIMDTEYTRKSGNKPSNFKVFVNGHREIELLEIVVEALLLKSKRNTPK